jgi:uncharacterized membrane protein
MFFSSIIFVLFVGGKLLISNISIFSGIVTKALLTTSSIELTGIISNSSFILSGISTRSFLLSTGIKIVFNPPFWQLVTFLLIHQWEEHDPLK